MSSSPIEQRKSISDDYDLSSTLRSGARKTITHYSTSTLARIDTGEDIIEYPTNNILYEYLDDIKDLKEQYTMTDDEYIRYYMRPDLFCYDNYKDTDLEWVILAINDIITPKDFIKKTIYMINPAAIIKLMSMIINAEKDYIKKNRSIYEEGQY